MKKIMLFMVAMVVLVFPVQGKLVLDDIVFDPAIIASGDEVDIVIQYHDESIMANEDRVGDPDYKFEVLLQPDDTLTKNYVTVQDSEGNNLGGTIYSGGNYNKKFRVKVHNNAPAGNYEFKLMGQWYKNGEPLSTKEFVRFKMPVKKEGIIIDVANLETIPSEVRPGDDYVRVETFIENVGEKDSKSVEVRLDLPKDLEASYSNNNRIWVGRLNAGEQKKTTFHIDVDDYAEAGVYELDFNFNYMDLDSNSYQKSRSIPFKIKERPYLEVINYTGEGLAGGSSKLTLTVKNTGSEDAESVDVRLIKENSQPFEYDVRSDYVGELEPGETGKAIFDININQDASFKEHDFKLVIRAKGDSDQGDDTIYQFARRAKFEVTGKQPNHYITIGAVLAGLVIIVLIINMVRKKK